MSVKQNMASLLQLSNDSIDHIISYLDTTSLGNILLTCKRLNELALNGKYLWQTEIHRMRALYYLTELCFDTNTDSSSVPEVLERALKSVSDIRMASDKMYRDIYERCGPVVAKLFKMIKNTSYDLESGHPRETCSTETNSFELHFLSGQKMYISGTHFYDAMMNYDREIEIKIEVGEKEYSCCTSGSCYPTDAYYYPDEIAEFHERFEALTEPFDLIYKEIGETQPPLTSLFFYWFANIDWSCPPLNDSGVSKYVFKNPESNEKAGSSKSEVNRLHDVTSAKWLTTMENWKESFNNKIAAADIVVETVRVMIKRTAEDVLESLRFDLDRILAISKKMSKYKHEVVKLMIRSTIFNPHPKKWTGSVADKHVNEYIAIRTNTGLVDIAMSACNDGASYPCWLQFTLTYNVPNGEKYIISSSEMFDGAHEVTVAEAVRWKIKHRRILSSEFFVKHSEMTKLQALADIFQEKVKAELGDTKDIPQLTNAFVFCYLVCATEFDRYGCDPEYFPKPDLIRLRNDHCTGVTDGSDSEDNQSD